MNLIYKPFIFLRKALIGAFVFLGVACSSDSEEAPGMSNDTNMPPTVNYIINGKVVSENDTNKGIPDLQVEVTFEEPYFYIDTLYTGAGGEFTSEVPVTTFGENVDFTLIITDVDGDENGRFSTLTRIVSFKENDVDKDITWYLGNATKNIIIKLQEINKD